ncbi:MAG: hypothetical protein EA412_08000 [Chitinophagaceae bacterium]|nr:MAG: hypothetical protein EA412_08000 [Chitinophagaceae bacterium]
MQKFSPRKTLLLLVIFTLEIFNISGNSLLRAEHDSLIMSLNYVVPDTNKVWLYRDISYYLLSTNPDSALIFSNKGYELARKIDFLQGKIWNLYQQALAYEYKDDFQTAHKKYQKAINLAEENSDLLSVAKLENALGAAFFFEGNLLNAIEHYEKAYFLSESIEYKEGMGHALNNLGIIFRQRRNYVKALEVYDRSLDLKSLENDNMGMAYTYFNKGLAYSYMNEHKKSIESFKYAEALFEKTNSLDEMHAVDIGKGIALFHLNELEEAKVKLESGLEFTSKINPLEYVAGLTYLGAIEIKAGKIKEGSEKIEMAYSLVKGSGRLDLLRRIYKERAIAKEYSKNYTEAILSWKEYTRLTEILNNEQQQWAIEEMQARFELKEKEQTIALQNLEIEKNLAQQQLYLIGSISLSALFLISTIILINRQKLNSKLKKSMSQTSIALEEKEELIHEMHHRIKNNLQLLQSLLNLQSLSITDAEAVRTVQSSKNSVNAIGLIHHQLYAASNFRKIEMHEYIEQLINQYQEAFQLSYKNIQLHNHSEKIRVDIDTAIPLGLIINELVTNAMKHAFEDKETGNIHISLILSNNELILEINDDGSGFIPDKKGSDSFGLKMIDTFSKKLKATLCHNNNEFGGTQVVYNIKKFKLHDEVS